MTTINLSRSPRAPRQKARRKRQVVSRMPFSVGDPVTHVRSPRPQVCTKTPAVVVEVDGEVCRVTLDRGSSGRVEVGDWFCRETGRCTSGGVYRAIHTRGYS